jgi:hypothetical protein
MRDPFTDRKVVFIKCFGKVKKLETEVTKEVINFPPTYVFNGSEEVLYVERQEDLYGSHHYTGKPAVRVKRSDWINAKVL